MVEQSKESLQKPIFPDKLSKQVFEEWLQINDRVTPIFVSRSEFNAKKWVFFEAVGEDKFWKKYRLTLPEDIKAEEVPAIIKKIDTLTYAWETTKNSEKLKVAIVLWVDTFLKKLGYTDELDIKITIKKYVTLYGQLYGEKEAHQLSLPAYRSQILATSWFKIQNEKERFVSIRTQEDLDTLLSEVKSSPDSESLPLYATSEKLKRLIVAGIDRYIKALGYTDELDIKITIKKYIDFYAQITSQEEAKKLVKEEYRNSILKDSKIGKDTIFSNLHSEKDFDNFLSDILPQLLNETFFQRGLYILTTQMRTITQQEMWEVNKKRDAIKSSPQKNTDWREEIISPHVFPRELEKEERFLKDKINIQELKEIIALAKQKGNKEYIEEAEFLATNKVISALYEYPYQLTKNDFGYQPSKILENKEIYCVGFSLLWHAFLQELGIEHYALDLEEHSALSVVIWWKRYYFDATGSDRIDEFTWGKQEGQYREMLFKKADVYWNKKTALEGDADVFLQAQVLGNKWASLRAETKNEVFYKESLMLNPNNALVLTNMWSIYNYKGEYQKALDMYDKAIQAEPNNFRANSYKESILEYMGKYEEALSLLDKLDEINPWNTSVQGRKVEVLLKMWKYNEALVSIDNFLSKNPNDANLLVWKWRTLMSLNRWSESLDTYNRILDLHPEESRVYREKSTVYQKLWSAKNEEVYRDASDYMIYNKFFSSILALSDTQEKIKDFIDKKDYKWLWKYLREIEKTDEK